MRNIVTATLLALAVLAVGLALALCVAGSQPQQRRTARNVYEPFTIEVSVDDARLM